MLRRSNNRVTSELDLTIRYEANEATRICDGLGKDIGVYRASQGDAIALYFDPSDPSSLDSAERKDWRGGLLLLAATGGFVAFYVWFFWRGNRPPTRPTFTGNGPRRPVRT